MLTIKRTIFIDGSIYDRPQAATARYTGQATIYASGTFGMKNRTICATHPGYTGACDLTATSPWDPNSAALVIVANGAAAPARPGPGERLQRRRRDRDEELGFQGGLIANQAIRVETASQMQGPMISVYNAVFAGQSNDFIFPPILFAPSGGGGIISDPPSRSSCRRGTRRGLNISACPSTQATVLPMVRVMDLDILLSSKSSMPALAICI